MHIADGFRQAQVHKAHRTRPCLASVTAQGPAPQSTPHKAMPMIWHRTRPSSTKHTAQGHAHGMSPHKAVLMIWHRTRPCLANVTGQGSGKRKPRVCRREAVGAWVLFALHWPALPVSQHQKSEGSNRNGLRRNDLSQLSQSLGADCEHANPLSMRLSQCSQLSQSKTRHLDWAGLAWLCLLVQICRRSGDDTV